MSMKRRIIWALLTVVIAALTIRTVYAYSGSLSPAQVQESFEGASPGWIAMTVLCMMGFIVFEALAILRILHAFGYRKNLFQGLYYSAGDQFFSAITPSASGGQPASGLFMGADGIPGAVITVTLILNLVMYTAATLSVGIISLVISPGMILQYAPFAKVLIIGGALMMALLMILFIGLLRKGEVMLSVGRRIIGFCARIHLTKRPEHWTEKLENLVRDHNLCARSVAGKKRVLVSAYLLNLAQRISQITVTLMLFYALGWRGTAAGTDVWAVQAFAQIGSNCVPIPGGMGAVDYLMLDGFDSLSLGEFGYQLQILSRSFSFYICTLVSGLIVLIGYAANRIRRSRHQESQEETGHQE